MTVKEKLYVHTKTALNGPVYKLNSTKLFYLFVVVLNSKKAIWNSL